MNINIFKTGYCIHPEKAAIKSGSFNSVKFPASFALINHPTKGYILFDTGYSLRFYEETKKFPYNIYAKITPVYIKEEETASKQLEKLGISSKEISYVILSHFHADHIGGCFDFPNAKFICSQKDYMSIKDKKGLSALKNGFIPKLLPNDFNQRTIFIETKNLINLPIINEEFPVGYDLFDDGSILAVNLEGHSKGQFGIFLSAKNKTYFFIGDACWLSKSYKELVMPSKIANIIMSDNKKFIDNINKLHSFNKNHPHIKIIPSHCLDTLDKEMKLLEDENER